MAYTAPTVLLEISRMLSDHKKVCGIVRVDPLPFEDKARAPGILSNNLDLI